MARNCEAIGSDLAPFARLPEEPNGVRTAPDSPQILTTIHYQGFFASKGGVCWSLLVSGPAFLVSWTALHAAPSADEPLAPTCHLTISFPISTS